MSGVREKFGWNPEAEGCRCYACPLGPLSVKDIDDKPFIDRSKAPWIPVPSEVNPGSRLAIVGENPGEDEEQELRPVVGPMGQVLMEAVRASGESRGSASYLNVVACRSPIDREKLRARIDRDNARRRKAAKEAGRGEPDLVAHPDECCAPRVRKELRSYDKLILLGAGAGKAVLGPDTLIMDVRGRPVEMVRQLGAHPSLDTYIEVHTEDGAPLPPGERISVMPSLNPAIVFHNGGRWRGPIRQDIRKAFNWFRTGLKWKPPEILYQPSNEQLRRFLFEWAPNNVQRLAFDFETGFEIKDGETPAQARWRALEPLLARPDLSDQTIRCLAIGTDKYVLLIGLLSIDHVTRLYPPDQERAIRATLKEFFENPPVELVSQNGICFDSLLAKYGLEAEIPPEKHLDTGPAHRLADNEMPHNLAFMGAEYTDAPAWKKDHAATQAKSDRALHQYCCFDVAIDHAVVGPILAQAVRNQQQHLLPLDLEIAHFCRSMYELGIPVNQATVDKHEARTTGEMLKWRAVCQELTGKKSFNPGAHPQVQELLFDTYGLPADENDKHAWTKLGNPSSADVILRDMLLDKSGKITPFHKNVIKAIRRYRRFQKQRGTFVWPCKPMGWSPSGKLADERGGCWPDGRIRPKWNPFAVVSGRLSCDEPNITAWPVTMGDIFEAPPGFVFVGFDMSQGEPRIVAARAGIRLLLDCFEKGGDSHELITRILVGDEYDKAAGHKKEKGTAKYRLRQLGKVGGLACLPPMTRVATFDARGWKRLDELAVGDWVYCWDGDRYAPTRVTAVGPTGVKPLVKVRMRDGVGRIKTVTATPDHRFLLRDGTYRAADALQLGDRLMPFRRAVGVHGKYRQVDATNSGAWEYEHRLMLPGAVEVHHKDHNGLNNLLENLEAFDSHGEHLSQHSGWKQPQSFKDELRRRSLAMWRGPKRQRYLDALARARESGRAAWEAAIAPRRWIKHVPCEWCGTVMELRSGRDTRGGGKLRRFCNAKCSARWRVSRHRPNHVVVGVETLDAAPAEVWCLTTEHDAHNFAIYDAVFVSNCFYGAISSTVHNVITKEEDKATGELLFPDITETRTEGLRGNLLAAMPELPRWWDALYSAWRLNGYVAGPLLGRRREFKDGLKEEDAGALANWEAQSGLADHVNQVTAELLRGKLAPNALGKGCGVVIQKHDHLAALVPENRAEEIAKLMRDVATGTYPQLPGVTLTVDVTISKTWEDPDT